MTPEDDSRQTPDDGAEHTRALAAPDTGAALRNAVSLWAEQNTRPETIARPEKLRDKVTAVTSFFEFAAKHPGDMTPGDVSRWRVKMEEGA